MYGKHNRTGQEGPCMVKFDTPPVICRMVPFPVTIAVANTGSRRLRLNSVSIRHRGSVRGRVYVGVELAPGGRPRRMPGRRKGLEGAVDDPGLNQAAIKVWIDPRGLINRGERGLELVAGVETEETGKTETIRTARPVRLMLSLEGPPLPGGLPSGNWYFGDTHCHSTYTRDYYFGNGIYTIPELKSLATAAGLDWLVLTEHSYNLSPALYERIKNETKSVSDESFSFFYGEELSAREPGIFGANTCHYNGIFNDCFIPSITDIFRKARAPFCQQAIQMLKEAGGLVILNHPGWGVSPLEHWGFSIRNYGLVRGETGIEIMNGGWGRRNQGALSRWIDRRLLWGFRCLPFAGSDTESDNHLGECYTVVYSPSKGRDDIKRSLVRGRHYVTTGPGLAVFAGVEGRPGRYFMGSVVPLGRVGKVSIFVSYTWPDSPLTVELVSGATGQACETLLDSRLVTAGGGYYIYPAFLGPGTYIRASAVAADEKMRAYTTPIWFE